MRFFISAALFAKAAHRMASAGRRSHSPDTRSGETGPAFCRAVVQRGANIAAAYHVIKQHRSGGANNCIHAGGDGIIRDKNTESKGRNVMASKYEQVFNPIKSGVSILKTA
jgi:hypothetical protein